MSEELALTVATATARVADSCLRTGPPERVGVELEWIVHDDADPTRPVGLDVLGRVLADCVDLPGRGVVTCEPGGQLELSSGAALGLAAAVTGAEGDLAILRASAAAHGLTLTGTGMDPVRPPRRVCDTPRYVAMAEHFAPYDPAGPQMMCSTASVQACMDAGEEGTGPGSAVYRWRTAHAIGPVLVAAFANSPVREGRRTGWRSTRWTAWSGLEPGRTLPVRLGPDGDLRAAYARYALDAPVLCVRTDTGPWTVPTGLTFREWITAPGDRPPTAEDLDYHLTTLFPPVRARGYLELRMIDAQPDDGWRVPLAVAYALMTDPKAAEVALAATEELLTDPDPWLLAARDGLSTPVLARAARECFDAALLALATAPAALRGQVAAFAERYVDRGLCPADEVRP